MLKSVCDFGQLMRIRPELDRMSIPAPRGAEHIARGKYSSAALPCIPNLRDDVDTDAKLLSIAQATARRGPRRAFQGRGLGSLSLRLADIERFGDEARMSPRRAACTLPARFRLA